MSHGTLVTSLLEGLDSPEDAGRRREAVRDVRRQEDDGEYLDGIFSLCRQACGKLEDANKTLGDARAALEELAGSTRSAGDFQSGDLVKAMSSAQIRISSIVRGFRKLEDAMGRQRDDSKGRLGRSAELIRQACARMEEASAMIGDARGLARATDQRARDGIGIGLRLSRRLRSRELLRAVSAVRGHLSRIVRTARTMADAQEGPVRDAVGLESPFE